MRNLHDCRETFASTLLDLAKRDPRVCLVINDCIGSSASTQFLAHFPERVIDVGIAEQNMVGVAAGLANAGRIPFVCAASCFLSGRSLEQIKVDIAYSRANVKLCGLSSGFAYGALGPTHHAVEDIAWIRTLPGIELLAPASPRDTAATLDWAYRHDGPVFMRVNRIAVPEIIDSEHDIDPRTGHVLRSGRDVALIGTGVMTSALLDAARSLSANGIDAMVLHLPRINPIDVDAIVRACTATRRVVTAEDHQLHGGFGSAIAETCGRHCPVPILSLGLPNVFAPTGSPQELFDHFRLSPAMMAEDIHLWLAASS